MSEAETMAMAGPMRPGGNGGATRTIPAQDPRRNSSWGVAVLAAFAVLALVALIVGLILRNGDNPGATAQAAMPDLIGNTEEDARALLTNAKLTNVTPSDDKTDCGAKNKVSKQNPAPGTQVKVDDPVTYQICVGPELVTVPGDLVGNTQESAKTRLEAIDLKPVFVQVDNAAAKGTVVSVDKQGDRVPPKTEIRVSVSRGNQLAVPNVVDKSADVARGILEQAGFEVNEVDGQATDTPGIVLRQNPAANRTAKRGDTITLTVSVAIEPPEPTDPGSPTPTVTPTTPPGEGGGIGIFP
jgi:serine/threonine-protein kinase